MQLNFPLKNLFFSSLLSVWPRTASAQIHESIHSLYAFFSKAVYSAQLNTVKTLQIRELQIKNYLFDKEIKKEWARIDEIDREIKYIAEALNRRENRVAVSDKQLESAQEKIGAFCEKKLQICRLEPCFLKFIEIIHFIGELLAQIVLLQSYRKKRYQSLVNRNRRLEEYLQSKLTLVSKWREKVCADFKTRLGRCIRCATLILKNQNEELKEKQKKLRAALSFLDSQKLAMILDLSEAEERKWELSATVRKLKEEQENLISKTFRLRIRRELLERNKLSMEQIAGKPLNKIKEKLSEIEEYNKKIQEELDLVHHLIEHHKKSNDPIISTLFFDVVVSREKKAPFITIVGKLGALPARADFFGEKEEFLPMKQHFEQTSDLSKKYKQLYGEKKTAAEVFKTVFRSVYLNLKNDASIRLNNSETTPSTRGYFAIFDLVALELILGATLKGGESQSARVEINETVCMRPSLPRRVLRLKSGEQKKEPCMELSYSQFDDFTPKSQNFITSYPRGVDSVAVKLILEQLSDRELAMVRSLLLRPIRDDNALESQQWTIFSKEANSRVLLVERACMLIQEIGIALYHKFQQSVLSPLLQEFFCEDIPPFTKCAEDDLVFWSELSMLKKHPFSPKKVEWKLDKDLIAIKKTDTVCNNLSDPQALVRYNQEPFFLLVEKAKKQYLEYFHDFSWGQTKSLAALGDKEYCGCLSWNMLKDQYVVSHQMIEHQEKKEGCLFSNLLSLLVVEKSDLKASNVVKLKKAMANYLRHLLLARREYLFEKQCSSGHTEALEDLKEKSDLAEFLEQSIQAEYQCSLEQYQNWLEGRSYGVKLDVDSLSPIEIQIAAYLFGVRIGLFRVCEISKWRIDEYGRMMPNDWWGPNTEEILLMAHHKNSYYGLFPKSFRFSS